MLYSKRSRYSRSPSPDRRYRRSVSSSRSRSRSCEPSVENPGNNLYVTGLPTRLQRETLRSISLGRGRYARRRRGRTPTPGRYLGLRTVPCETSIAKKISPSPYYGFRVDHILPAIAREGPTHDLDLLISYGSRSPVSMRNQSRYYSPDDYYYRRSRYRSVSRSISPRVWRSSRRSYSRSVSPRPRRGSRKSYSRSISPRRLRRSYSRSMSPLYKRSARKSYSPSISPRPRSSRSHGSTRDSYSSRSHSRSHSRAADYRSVSRSVTPRSDSPLP
ncbi:hypothetical protein Acr_28g0006080 [Actinidia rufa]|uniref:Uncharacterized protein n=1 Tax=Actinidia rufa TaxID=165716 RepID=A0A7J0H9W2_9ERIC|nr:hypothetical protein Acr_28g0006080 [Actinidia rufa]